MGRTEMEAIMRSTISRAASEADFIGANILTLADTNRNLLPDRMDAKRVHEDIIFYIDGRAVTRFAQQPLFEIASCTMPGPNVFGEKIGLDLQVDMTRSGDQTVDIILQRDWEVILELSLEIDYAGSRRLDWSNYQADDNELDTLHNYLQVTCGKGFDRLGGTTLIDRIAFESGSADPRLLKLLSGLDAQIESGVVERKLALIEERQRATEEVARRAQENKAREERQAGEIAEIVDNFFLR
jgi:hypothetical protein